MGERIIMREELFEIQDDIETHPVAFIVPSMDNETFKELKEDISGNGLIEPIVLFQDKILDGRSRFRACVELEIAITARNWEGGMDPVEYVVSKNICRRQLTNKQREVSIERAIHFYVENE